MMRRPVLPMGISPTLGVPPSPGRDVIGRWLEEFTQLRAWPYVQLRSQQVVVALELPQRLGAVVLRQVHLDQSGMRALTQRIHPGRSKGGLSGVAIPAGGGEQFSKCLQGMQA